MTEDRADPLAPIELAVTVVTVLVALLFVVAIPVAVFGNGAVFGLGEDEACATVRPGTVPYVVADGVPVVIHDGTLQRTTTGQGLVSEKTVAELAHCRLQGREEEGVTTLDTVLEALAGTSVTLGVEIKTGPDAAPYPDFEANVLGVLQRHGVLDRTMMLSFVPDCLERVRAVVLASRRTDHARPVTHPARSASAPGNGSSGLE